MDASDPAFAALAEALEATVREAREAARTDPFANPVLRVALALTRRLDAGELDEAALAGMLGHLGRAAIADRAVRLAAYVGLEEGESDPFAAVAERLAGEAGEGAEGFARYRTAVERTRFAAVFTAHPTFGMTKDLAASIAARASGEEAALPDGLSFRPDDGITLHDEFEQARAAVRHARDAIDALNASLLAVARTRWPDAWHTLVPRPVTLGSWVGCDTDGRNDIGWWDTLRYRLESKRTQFARLLATLPEGAGPAAEAVRSRAGSALAAVERQLAAVPGPQPDLEALRRLALTVLVEREAALPEAGPLLAEFDHAIAETLDEAARTALCLARAGCAAHGVSVALPHFRLNASQVHNAMRRTIALDGEPTQPARRRPYLAAVNAALDRVETVPVDFGALTAERASAKRMLMTVAQIVKHVDGTRPVRFLVAETETGYTLLSVLWIARRLGIAGHVEISPLFETAEALEQGPRIIEEALRSPHWRAYLKRQGRLCLQFGYSDSGRYVGQLAATFWIERLRLRLCELLARHDLAGVELVLFDTHGESVGRGAHPASLAHRFAYFAPRQTRARFARAGIEVVRETSFQGSDGYLLFGSPTLAKATMARIAEHVFEPPEPAPDPIYDEPDFAAEFFETVGQEMGALVDDPGYAALIGTFGPALLDKTGSRPAARQSDVSGAPRIGHPRELRAIPNNAILQQLGWLANSVHGLGLAASRAPERFRAMRSDSHRFARAYALAEHAVGMSDLDVLRAYIDSLDPALWFDRARRARREERREELLGVAAALARLDLAPGLRRLFGRFAEDALALSAAAQDLPRMSDRLVALHALRIAAIHRIWLIATHIPGFRPQGGLTWEALMECVLRLDVPATLGLLAEVFPRHPDPTAGLDFGEPAAPRDADTYEALHADVLEPMARWFALVREASGAIQHEIGAYG